VDTVTQIALGAAVSAACVPKEHRRKAVMIGAILGTTPDLDVFIDYGDAVSNFTYHRGFTHSLFVLLPFSLLLWAILKKLYKPVRSAPGPWLLAIMLTLVTHPLLDAHTAYGTQLFWPLASPPVMWSTIFIIDPLYTIPLLVGVIAILIRPLKAWAGRTLAVGLLLSTGYLAWTWSAKLYVEERVIMTLESHIDSPAASHEQSIAIYTTPAPFNSLLWRIVVLRGDDYLEGYYSFLDSDRPIEFDAYPKNNELFAQVKNFWAAKRLDWFAQGFIKSSMVGDYLVISDLRMGFEDNYVFNHAIARIGNPHYHEIESILLPSGLNAEDLPLVWNRLLGK
jgi:inner membrane protein